MQFDVYFDHMVQHKKLFEATRSVCNISTLWIVRVGKLSVSIEILKPERKTNHGKPTESRGRTKPDE